MKLLKAVIIILVMAINLAAVNTIPMEDLSNPRYVKVDKDNLYITEGTTVFIYSAKDFKLKTKFGKKGEGPGEFLIGPFIPMTVNIIDNKLQIISRGKVSLFTKAGKYISERKLGGSVFASLFMPVDGNYAAFGIYRGQDKIYRNIAVYDKNFKQLKELVKLPHDFAGRGRGYNCLVPYSHAVLKNRVYVPWNEKFKIDVFDKIGNKTQTIELDYENRPVKQADKDSVLNYFKNDKRTGPMFNAMKPFRFPENFPAIREISTAEDRIYCITYKKNSKGESEVFVVTEDGKLKKKIWLGLEEIGLDEFYPYAFTGNRFLQIVENEDGDGWELKEHKFTI